jgi:N6-L-threonylcarbamoyladenine synthase
MSTLGIDTSNYTTSIALSDGLESLLIDRRVPLKVKSGAVGLRQSDAFYQHISNLREMIESLKPYYDSIDTVVVSNQPRNLPDSYMPVFNAGVFFAQSLALNQAIQMRMLSHQEGHIFSGFNRELFEEPEFFALHISGGTTEMLKVCQKEERLLIDKIDGTLDLSFGQLIDRIGQYLEMSFPAGKELDELVETYQKSRIKLSLKENGFNISGIENKLKRRFDEIGSKEETANQLFSFIYEMIDALIEKHVNNQPLLIVGGVGESRFLRSMLNRPGIYFTNHKMSSDNAVGLSRYPYIMEALCV